MKRQPIVVSTSSPLPRGKPRSGFSITSGARDIDSTPPASTRSASPSRICARGLDDRLEPGGAEPVDGHAGHLHRQARRSATPSAPRCGCPRPPGSCSPCRPRRPWPGRARCARPPPRSTRAARSSGPHGREHARVAADRRAERVDDHGFRHGRGSVHSARVDEFAAFVVFGSLVVVGIFLAIGRWYPGLGRRAGGLAPDALARGRGRARDRRRRPDDRGAERRRRRDAAAARSPRPTSAPRWRRTSAGATSCAGGPRARAVRPSDD